MSDWKPIETAPRDGKIILVWNHSYGHWIASFRPPLSNEPGFYDHRAMWEWRDSYGRFATPTHWMPLPQAPMSK